MCASRGATVMNDVLQGERQAPATGRRASEMQPSAFHFIIALNPQGRAAMTRDMDLIRKIIVNIQSRNDVSPREVTIADEEEWKVVRHLELLLQAGLIEAFVNCPGLGPSSLPKFSVIDLTMSGHDFAATIQNESVWSELKESSRLPSLRSFR